MGRDTCYNNAECVISGYVGPGDAVAGIGVWYGVRSFSAATLFAGLPIARLTRASDSAACDFIPNATGGFGNTAVGCAQGGNLTPTVFAGTDGTGTCTISTTTATCTGATGTGTGGAFHVGDLITGAGVTEPCIVITVSGFTAGSGTATVKGVGSSPCGTVSVGVTMTFTWALSVTTLYDQSQKNNCSSAPCNLGGSGSVLPEFIPNCHNSLPCIFFNTGWNTRLTNVGGGGAPMAAAFGSFVGVVGNVLTATEGHYAVMDEWDNTVNLGASNNFGYELLAGGTSPATEAESCNAATCAHGTGGTISGTNWAVIGATIAAINSRTAYLDAVAGTLNSTSVTQPTPTIIAIGSLQFKDLASNYLQGFFAEAGQWSVLSAGNMTTLCHNAFLYWGTATSC